MRLLFACLFFGLCIIADGLAVPWNRARWTIDLVNGHGSVEYLAKGGRR